MPTDDGSKGMLDDLAENCAGVAAAAKAAATWIERNREYVGSGYSSSWRAVRRGAFEARNLEKAARRPPAICVYGESQFGKSYLIGTLARKAGGMSRSLLKIA